MIFSKAAILAVLAVAPATTLQAFAKRVNEDLPEEVEPIYMRELKKGKKKSGKGKGGKGKGGEGTCPNAKCDLPLFEGRRKLYDYSDKYGSGRGYAPPPSPIDVSCCKEFDFQPGIEFQCNGLTDEYTAISQIIQDFNDSCGSKGGCSPVGPPRGKTWCCKKDCLALEEAQCVIIPQTLSFPDNPLCGGIPKGSKKKRLVSRGPSRSRRDRLLKKKGQEESAPVLKPRALGPGGKGKGGSGPGASPTITLASGICNDGRWFPPGEGPFTEVALEGLPNCEMQLACCPGGVTGASGLTPFEMLDDIYDDDYAPSPSDDDWY